MDSSRRPIIQDGPHQLGARLAGSVAVAVQNGHVGPGNLKAQLDGIKRGRHGSEGVSTAWGGPAQPDKMVAPTHTNAKKGPAHESTADGGAQRRAPTAQRRSACCRSEQPTGKRGDSNHASSLCTASGHRPNDSRTGRRPCDRHGCCGKCWQSATVEFCDFTSGLLGGSRPRGCGQLGPAGVIQPGPKVGHPPWWNPTPDTPHGNSVLAHAKKGRQSAYAASPFDGALQDGYVFARHHERDSGESRLCCQHLPA